MSSAILINPFQVNEGAEDEFLAFWESAAQYMKRQPGFISTRLHRSLGPDARFQFVNIAEWESPKHFQDAIGAEEFKRLTEPYMEVFPHFPALYEVVRTGDN